jgi:hypothetical protein
MGGNLWSFQGEELERHPWDGDCLTKAIKDLDRDSQPSSD